MKHSETVTFGGSGLDRASHLRADPSEVDRLWRAQDTRVIVYWRGKPLLDPSVGTLIRVGVADPILAHETGPRLFLGLDEASAVFAVDISDWQPDADQKTDEPVFFATTLQEHPCSAPGTAFGDLKTHMTRLSVRDAELAATARSLFAWHRSHGFCACCGTQSETAMAGWQRNCPDCGAAHFPRTDPVVIMLITDGNRTLLGRGTGWPEGMFSCLAGFMEPGETIEAAVRREVSEEAGVSVGAVTYLASQPWAFPSSLMIGCHGEATSNDITLDPTELEEARWVTREELRDALAGEHPDIRPAREGAIARFLMVNWLADRLD